jgi:hypothetical protein
MEEREAGGNFLTSKTQLFKMKDIKGIITPQTMLIFAILIIMAVILLVVAYTYMVNP